MKDEIKSDPDVIAAALEVATAATCRPFKALQYDSAVQRYHAAIKAAEARLKPTNPVRECLDKLRRALEIGAFRGDPPTHAETCTALAHLDKMEEGLRQKDLDRAEEEAVRITVEAQNERLRAKLREFEDACLEVYREWNKAPPPPIYLAPVYRLGQRVAEERKAGGK